MSESSNFEHRKTTTDNGRSAGTSGTGSQSFPGSQASSSGQPNVGERAQSAINQTAQRMSDQGQQVQENVQAVAGNLGDALEKSLREQPYTTLALAAAMGFVLGAIWKS